MKKILVVDDDRDIVHLIHDSLVLENFDVEIVFSGEEAIRKIGNMKIGFLIKNIRKKLGVGFESELMKIVGGVGYKFVPEVMER